MISNMHTVQHDDGTFQKYFVVSDFDWDDMNYFCPGIEPKSIKELVRLYTVNIIPKMPLHVGPFVFFNIPIGMDIPFSRDTEYGRIYDNNVLFRIILEKEAEQGRVSCDGQTLTAVDPQVQEVIDKIESMKLLGIADDEGGRPIFLAVNEKLGFVSRKKAAVTVNSHFFLMDPTDMDSPYCKIGTPHGLILQKGHVMNPPLNHRLMLLVDGADRAQLAHVELSELTFMIEGREYVPGKNCEVHFRPDERVTPKHEGCDIVITEEAVVAVKEGGETVIPCAGFVLSIPAGDITIRDTAVVYGGMEGWKFGAQVGPAMVEDGVMKDHMDFPFYRMGIDPVVYAPTVYPLSYDKGRASRICIGSDANEKPVVIWAEGEGKLGMEKEKDSTGAALMEMAEFCKSQGYRNIINLDGGGSASLTFRGKRYLRIADRMPVTNDECERPVPNGIYIV